MLCLDSILDVSDLRSPPRTKWIHCFEAITSIIFCAALSDYDQALFQDIGYTRMTESLALFESFINSRWFRKTSVILFLTKVDVFKAKLANEPLEKYFPEYTDGVDVNKAAKYILSRFIRANRANLRIYAQ